MGENITFSVPVMSDFNSVPPPPLFPKFWQPRENLHCFSICCAERKKVQSRLVSSKCPTPWKRQLIGSILVENVTIHITRSWATSNPQLSIWAGMLKDLRRFTEVEYSRAGNETGCHCCWNIKVFLFHFFKKIIGEWMYIICNECNIM